MANGMEICSESRSERDLMLAAIREKSSWFLEDASPELKGDKDFMLEAIGYNGWVFRYASADLKDDEEVAVMAIRKNSWALQHVSLRLKDCEAIVLMAIENNAMAFKPKLCPKLIPEIV